MEFYLPYKHFVFVPLNFRQIMYANLKITSIQEIANVIIILSALVQIR